MLWSGQLPLALLERDTVCLQECAGARAKTSAKGGISALQSVVDTERSGARRSAMPPTEVGVLPPHFTSPGAGRGLWSDRQRFGPTSGSGGRLDAGHS